MCDKSVSDHAALKSPKAAALNGTGGNFLCIVQLAVLLETGAIICSKVAQLALELLDAVVNAFNVILEGTFGSEGLAALVTIESLIAVCLSHVSF